MKFHIIFGVLFTVLLAEVRSEVWDDNDEHCAQKLNLKRVGLESFEDRQVVPIDNDNFNKFLTCSLKRAGIINDNGEINWDVLDDHYDKEFKADFQKLPNVPSADAAIKIIEIAIENCRASNLQGTVPEQNAVVVRNCIADEVVRQVNVL